MLFIAMASSPPPTPCKILVAELFLEKAKSEKSKSKKARKPASKAKPIIAAELEANKENNRDLEDDHNAHSVR